MAQKYSVCITTYNDVATVEGSLKSIFNQLDDSYEVVIVDNFSGDGSHEIIKGLCAEKGATLLQKKCSRGKGRQIAFEASTGEVVISNLDTDEVYLPRLGLLVEAFERLPKEGLLLALSEGGDSDQRQNVTIGSRSLIREIGGWRDVNYGEDWDLWRRAAEVGKFSCCVLPLVAGQIIHDKSLGVWPRLRFRYNKYLSMIQLGRNVLSQEVKTSYSQRGVYMMARCAAMFKPKFSKNVEFNPYDSKYLIPTGKVGQRPME